MGIGAVSGLGANVGAVSQPALKATPPVAQTGGSEEASESLTERAKEAGKGEKVDLQA